MPPTCASDEAKAWLQEAVSIAGSRDAALWDRNVGERARVAAIHFALRSLVERETTAWHVDAEYDKFGADPKLQPGLTPTTRRQRKGTPDLMIHRRGGRGASHNLIVVEFKKTYSNLEDGSSDIRKIEYWAENIGYRVGAVVGLGPSGSLFAPKVRWYEEREWSQREDISR